MKKRIAIMGLGMVGGALSRWFSAQGHEILPYDPPQRIGTAASLEGADLVIVAVPTPFDEAKNRYDYTALESAISTVPGGKPIIIKSTISPGTTKTLQGRYPQHQLLFTPEFLSEATADKDVASPMFNIVGYTDASKNIAGDILALFARAPYEKIMPAAEAELFKCARNAFFAAKVVFMNQIYDLAEAMGVDYETVRDCFSHDGWVGGGHTVVWHKGYRGYGGKCLPKEVRALIALARDQGIELELLKAAEAVNATLSMQKQEGSA